MAKDKRSQAEPDEIWVTLQEAAERTGCSVAALRKWYRAEEIRKQMDGNRVLVELREVQRRYRGPLRVGDHSRPRRRHDADRKHEIAISATAWDDLVEERQLLRVQLEEAIERAARAEALLDALRVQLKYANGGGSHPGWRDRPPTL